MMKNTIVALSLALAMTAHAAGPTQEEVGDADSFSRNMVYLGLGTPMGFVNVRRDCTSNPDNPPLPNDRCVTMRPQPAVTSWNESGMGSVRLPANSTNSLICFTITSHVAFQFINLTGVRQPTAQYRAGITFAIDNPVLDDPTIIDPWTGRPYNGRWSIGYQTYFESRSIDAGERDEKNIPVARGCSGWLVTRQSLIEGGLTEAQARQFFREPMTLTFGSTGSAQIVDYASFGYGIRLYGDTPDE